MNINTDINILGSVLDLTIMNNVLDVNPNYTSHNTDLSKTKLKTTRSLQRYERAIKNTLVFFREEKMKDLFNVLFLSEGLSEDCLYLLFLNASSNNDLLNYFNQNIFFPAMFSGRIAVRKSEIIACINDLKQAEEDIRKWSDSTIDVVARKYLALLAKFNLVEDTSHKSIKQKYITDKQFILFIYWLIQVEIASNILESKWLQYSFLEKETFIERVLQKKFMKYLNVLYTGDSMKLETKISYKDLYNELTKS